MSGEENSQNVLELPGIQDFENIPGISLSVCPPLGNFEGEKKNTEPTFNKNKTVERAVTISLSYSLPP